MRTEGGIQAMCNLLWESEDEQVGGLFIFVGIVMVCGQVAYR